MHIAVSTPGRLLISTRNRPATAEDSASTSPDLALVVDELEVGPDVGSRSGSWLKPVERLALREVDSAMAMPAKRRRASEFTSRPSERTRKGPRLWRLDSRGTATVTGRIDPRGRLACKRRGDRCCRFSPVRRQGDPRCEASLGHERGEGWQRGHFQPSGVLRRIAGRTATHTPGIVLAGALAAQVPGRSLRRSVTLVHVPADSRSRSETRRSDFFAQPAHADQARPSPSGCPPDGCARAS